MTLCMQPQAQYEPGGTRPFQYSVGGSSSAFPIVPVQEWPDSTPCTVASLLRFLKRADATRRKKNAIDRCPCSHEYTLQSESLNTTLITKVYHFHKKLSREMHLILHKFYLRVPQHRHTSFCSNEGKVPLSYRLLMCHV
ncbi:hypothetical protein MKW98_015284 [Papaver atlanticum]|uniref:Uncharacterized protein n=1 Tax=Papaver atlanticum TaxID=357466 RepID=A0AAD4T5I2_9MAGN|nr:hypothetical protein MKW98_015284 [Papaver atlanticum]